jgi:hypothetical protein
MPYVIACTDCEFTRQFTDRAAAHEEARQHELERPEHHVSLRRQTG